MTEQPDTANAPEWDLADRLRKALREAEVSSQEMAEYLEIGRHTVSNWINGRTRPRKSDLRLWAMRCGVPYEWLATGQLPRGSSDQPRGWSSDHDVSSNNINEVAPNTSDVIGNPAPGYVPHERLAELRKQIPLRRPVPREAR